jgi:hypothetical protein
VKRVKVVGGFVTPNARTLFSRVLTKDLFRRSIESASLLHELGMIESVPLWSAIPELPSHGPSLSHSRNPEQWFQHEEVSLIHKRNLGMFVQQRI